MSYKEFKENKEFQKRKEERRKWREEEALEIEATKEELAKDHGLERNAKFDRAWDIAWSYGHSSGFHEVKNYFNEIADLIKP